MRWQWGLAAAVLIGSIVVPALAADDNLAAPGGVFSKMIGGKEWRVEPVAGTNNFKVTWGDKTVTWTPKPWQPRELQQQGPSYYWKIFGEKTPYYPIDKTMDERAKLDGQDVERGWVLVEDTSQMLDWKGGFCFDIISAGGEVRTRCGIEWKRAYLRPEYKAVRNSTTPPLLNKRFIVLTAPRSVRGIGFLTFV